MSKKHRSTDTSNQKNTAVVRCPRCNRPQPKQGGNDHIYYCEYCRAMFDDDPLDGGDWSDRNPAARIEREERMARRKF